jgi:hypothetical protein
MEGDSAVSLSPRPTAQGAGADGRVNWMLADATLDAAALRDLRGKR